MKGPARSIGGSAVTTAAPGTGGCGAAFHSQEGTASEGLLLGLHSCLVPSLHAYPLIVSGLLSGG